MKSNPVDIRGGTGMDIFNLIQESGHLYPEGNNDYGYGVPNFYEVLQYVSIEDEFLSQRTLNDAAYRETELEKLRAQLN